MTEITLNTPTLEITSTNQLKFLKKQKIHHYIVIIARILVLFAFLFSWEYTTSTGIIDSFIFSSPSKICNCFWGMVQDGSIFLHIGVTLGETILSFFLVLVTTLTISVLLWFFPRVAEVLDPYFVMLNSLPKSALAPLLIVWLGANTTTIVFAGMSVAIFGSIISLYNHFQQIDEEEVKLIYTLKGTRAQALTKVVLPSSIPTIISLMKVNIGLCLVGVVIGEFLAARNGLGYLIIYASQVFKMDWLLMSIVLLCIMAIGLYALINIAEKCYNNRYGK